MDAFIGTVSQILIDWGYPGLFTSALLAEGIIPSSSEIILLGLVKLGPDPTLCLISASSGNTAGGMTYCYMGRLGKVDWVEEYLEVKKERVGKMQCFPQGRGALTAFFTFLPAIGEIVSMTLGFMRGGVWLATVSMFARKLIHYVTLPKAMQEILNLIM